MNCNSHNNWKWTCIYLDDLCAFLLYFRIEHPGGKYPNPGVSRVDLRLNLLNYLTKLELPVTLNEITLDMYGFTFYFCK